jgi:hypothetical protein
VARNSVERREDAVFVGAAVPDHPLESEEEADGLAVNRFEDTLARSIFWRQFVRGDLISRVVIMIVWVNC